MRQHRVSPRCALVAGALSCFFALPGAWPKADARRSFEPVLNPQPDSVANQAAEATTKFEVPSDASASRDEPATRPRRLAWAELLRRVFAADVLECPRCGRRMRMLAAIHPPEATQAILECLDLPSRAPPTTAPLADDAALAPSWEADFEARD